MHNRKEFLKLSVTAALGGLILPKETQAFFHKKQNTIGLQSIQHFFS